MQTIAVFGAGVAGMTVAHELACRGYSVIVYEQRAQIGGKCRTQYWGSKHYPGEHGFRFFPSFYRNVPNTMSRIPLDPVAADTTRARAPYPDSVWSRRMRGIDVTGIGKDGDKIADLPRSKPSSPSDIAAMIHLFFTDMNFGPVDSWKLAWKLFDFYRHGDKRRLDYDRISLWDYLGASYMGQPAQRMLEKMPKTLVAMSAREGNARTLLNVLFLMIRTYGDSGPAERILDGPTSQSWLEPWKAWLQRLGVTFQTGELTGLGFDRPGRRITSATVSSTAVPADCYVVAVPLERIVPLVSQDMADSCSELRKLRHAGSPPAWLDPDWALRWMVGAQFYLKSDRPITDGHVAFSDAPWALTGISQAQFWAPGGQYRPTHGGGDHDGVLSVIASDWLRERGAVHGKVARQCSQQQLYDELLHQVGQVLGKDGVSVLQASNVADYHLDDDIQWLSPTAIGANHSRLLIHPPHQWSVRPEARGQISNLLLAGDYVRTPIDLATMEGANEAGRAAASAALDFLGHAAGDRPPIEDHLAHAEPDWLKALKAADDLLFDLGQGPWAPVAVPGEVLLMPPEGREREYLLHRERRLRDIAARLDPQTPLDPELFRDIDLGPLNGPSYPLPTATRVAIPIG